MPTEEDKACYELKRSFEYDFEGSKVQAESITFLAPNASHLALTSKIGQMIMRASMDARKQFSSEESEKSKKQEDVTGDFFVGAVQMASNCDFTAFCEMFQRLFQSGTCKIDGTTLINKTLIDKIPPEDLMGMMGAYLENFMKSFVAMDMTGA